MTIQSLAAAMIIQSLIPWRSNAFLTGGVITSCVIQIPLRFQAVHNESAWHAGVRLIPFGVGIPIGAGLTATICGKRRLPIIYMLVPSFVLQILGLVFMSRLNVGHITWKGQYGLQFITGLGCGFSIGVITLMTPFVIEKRDLGKCSMSSLTRLPGLTDIGSQRPRLRLSSNRACSAGPSS